MTGTAAIILRRLKNLSVVFTRGRVESSCLKSKEIVGGVSENAGKVVEELG